jgi:hypothetical protein
MDNRKEAICNALAAFIRQRPGLEFGNYGSLTSYRAEQRRIARDKQDAETLLAYVRGCVGITADALIEASRGAYSGRLSIVVDAGPGVTLTAYADNALGRPIRINYCTGQYFPTEYRRAVCAVLASAIWAHVRDKCMPAPETYRVEWADGSTSPVLSPEEVDAYIAKRKDTGGGHPYKVAYYDAAGTRRAGDWLRRHFRAEFGRALQRRWFD